MTQPLNFQVFADYNQYFLLDDDVQPPYPEDVPQIAIDQRFQVRPHLIAIYTALPRTVSVTIHVGNVEPVVSTEYWSHVIKGSVFVPSGRLALAGCTDFLPECPRISVPFGECQFFLCGRGFDEAENEEYDLHLWPATAIEAMVVKSYVADHG